MNLAETKALIDFIKELRPYQKWGETPEVAWHAVFGDDPSQPGDSVTIEEAIRAVRRAARTETWITTEVVWREVEAQREKREGVDFETLPAPAVDPDDVAAYNAELRRMIADGVLRKPFPVDPAALERQRRMIGSAFSPRPVRRPAADERPDGWWQARAQAGGHDEEFLRRRAQANTHRCRDCGAPVGRVCQVDGQPLRNSPAHPARMVAAGLEAPQRMPTRAELDAWLDSVQSGD